MQRFFKALLFVKKKITWFLLLDMVLAIGVSLLWPEQVSALKAWVLLASFLMIYPMMINHNLSDLWGALRRPRRSFTRPNTGLTSFRW